MKYKDIMNKTANYLKQSKAFTNVEISPMLKRLKIKGPFILLKESKNKYIVIQDELLKNFQEGHCEYSEFLDKEWLNMNRHNFNYYKEYDNQEEAEKTYNNMTQNYKFESKNRKFDEYGQALKSTENLPDGWKWVQYDDGSGHLDSPEHKKYFFYDLSTKEFKIKKDDEYEKFEGSFEEFKKYAEKFMKYHLIEKEKEISSNSKEYKLITSGDNGKLIFVGDNSWKVEGEYDTQGFYYKNKQNYEIQKTLTKRQFDLLPVENKICYVAECENNSIINNQNFQKYIENGGVSSYFSIREEVEACIGEDYLDRFIEEEIIEMCDDVFETLDWQCASSLISGDYLDGSIEDKLEESEEDEI